MNKKNANQLSSHATGPVDDELRESVTLSTPVRRPIQIPGVHVQRPKGTFYVFPEVSEICNRLGITSHGLALYTLKGADDHFGVACLGGECFGDAGQGFLRFSCAEPDDRIEQALEFLPEAFSRVDRVNQFLNENPQFRLKA